MNVQLTWATPNAEELIVKMARVSAPKNQDNMDTAPRLLRYLIKHKHWSPFEMSNFCVEIETTRAISPQILRHRSFSFQEFCLAGNARITVSTETGAVQRLPIEELYSKWNKNSFRARYARSYDPEMERFISAPILSVYQSGEKPVYQYTIKTSDSYKTIDCTQEHRILTKEKGFVPFKEAYDQGLSVGMTAKWGRITAEKYLGIQMTYDIEMDHPTHNFVANGIVVHNSQRYADTSELGSAVIPHLRRQDHKNRQNSIDDLSSESIANYYRRISKLYEDAEHLYREMVSSGVAKECARSILPLSTQTRLFMNGTIRSWIHYLQLRCDPGTQFEHRQIAGEIKRIFCKEFPVIGEAAFTED